MLKIIKKALLLSLFACSFIFSMSQVVQTVMNVFPKNQVALIASATIWNQSRSFNNSFAARCPANFLEMVMQSATNETKVLAAETIKAEIRDEALDALNTQTITTTATDSQDTVNNTQDKPINQSRPSCCIDLRQEQEITYWQPSLTMDKIHEHHDYMANQAAREFSSIMYRVQVEDQQKAYIAKIKDEIFSNFYNFHAIVKNKACSSIKPYSSLSHQEISNKKTLLSQDLCKLESELLSITQQNYKISSLCNAIFGFQDELSPYDIIDKLSIEEYDKALKALNLKIQIESIKAAMQEYDSMIHRSEQEERDFVNKLENASLDMIEKQIIPDLVAKKDKITCSFIEKRNELNYKNDEFNIIQAQLELLDKRSVMTKFIKFLRKDLTKQHLLLNINVVQGERKKTIQQLELLNNEKIKCSARIEYAQKIADQKKQIELQQAQLLKEKQEQDALVIHEIVKTNHDSCNFEIENCQYPELAKQWSQRQEALSKTIEQGYVQYDQEFHLVPQTVAFLAICGIDYKQYQSFFGTALQQQLHGEMCDVLSQAAILQAKFTHTNNLLTSVVDFADAAYDANKNNQVFLSSRLLDVDCYLLKINSQIINSIINDPIAYAKAGISAVEHGISNVAHMVVHPVETFKGLGKAIYYVLETAAFNCSEDVVNYPEIYKPMRDKRNAEIVQALQNLGDQIKNSSGPERFGALVQFCTEAGVSTKVIHAVGGVCGVLKSQAKVLRTVEGVASMIEDERIAQKIIQATEKLEIVARENITKNVATELSRAEKQYIKSLKSLIAETSEPIRTNEFGIIQERSFVEKKISALQKAQQEAVNIKELPDGRIRYYQLETPSKNPGPTRGRSHVTEFDPKTNHVRQWEECYDHSGNVNRIHIKMIDGKSIDSSHYPLTKKELEIIKEIIKGENNVH